MKLQTFGHAPLSHAKGSTLIVGLIMLLMLTIVGIAGTRETLMQEKMAGSARDRDIALQSAEAALRAGEAELQGVSPPDFTNSYGLYEMMDREDANGNAMTEQAFWRAWGWVNEDSVAFTGDLDNVTVQPRYVIEELASALSEDVGSDTTGTTSSQVSAVDLQSGEFFSNTKDYRVTAAGWGASGDASVILQTTFRR